MKKSEYKEIAARFRKLAEDTGRLREHGIESVTIHLDDEGSILPDSALQDADRITVRVVQLSATEPYNVEFVRDLLAEAGVRKSDLQALLPQGSIRRFRIDIPFEDALVEVRRSCGCAYYIKSSKATERKVAKLESTECFVCKWDLDRQYAADMKRGRLPYFKGSRISCMQAFNIRGKHYRDMLEYKGALIVRSIKEFAALANSGQMSGEAIAANVAKRQKELEDIVKYITKERFMGTYSSCWVDSKDDPPINWEAEFDRVRKLIQPSN